MRPLRGMFKYTSSFFLTLTFLLFVPAASIAGDSVLTELEKAFQNQDIPTATRILGQNIDVKREMRWPIIVAASNHGRADIVRSIIETGANVNAINNSGDTAAILAAYNNYPEVIKLLASHGANLDIYGHDGGTALIWAAKKGHVEVVRILLSHGADTNLGVRQWRSPQPGSFPGAFPGREGNTPLIVAAENGHVDIVNILLDAGADINATNVDCLGALDASNFSQRHSVAALLESRGAIKQPKCLGSSVENYVMVGFFACLIALLVWEYFHAQSGARWRIAGYISNIFLAVFIVALSMPVALYITFKENMPIILVILIIVINIVALVVHNSKSARSAALLLNKTVLTVTLIGSLISLFIGYANEMGGVVVVILLAMSLVAFVNIYALRAQP